MQEQTQKTTDVSVSCKSGGVAEAVFTCERNLVDGGFECLKQQNEELLSSVKVRAMDSEWTTAQSEIDASIASYQQLIEHCANNCRTLQQLKAHICAQQPPVPFKLKEDMKEESSAPTMAVAFPLPAAVSVNPPLASKSHSSVVLKKRRLSQMQHSDIHSNGNSLVSSDSHAVGIGHAVFGGPMSQSRALQQRNDVPQKKKRKKRRRKKSAKNAIPLPKLERVLEFSSSESSGNGHVLDICSSDSCGDEAAIDSRSSARLISSTSSQLPAASSSNSSDTRKPLSKASKPRTTAVPRLRLTLNRDRHRQLPASIPRVIPIPTAAKTTSEESSLSSSSPSIVIQTSASMTLSPLESSRMGTDFTAASQRRQDSGWLRAERANFPMFKAFTKAFKKKSTKYGTAHNVETMEAICVPGDSHAAATGMFLLNVEDTECDCHSWVRATWMKMKQKKPKPKVGRPRLSSIGSRTVAERSTVEPRISGNNGNPENSDLCLHTHYRKSLTDNGANDGKPLIIRMQSVILRMDHKPKFKTRYLHCSLDWLWPFTPQSFVVHCLMRAVYRKRSEAKGLRLSDLPEQFSAAKYAQWNECALAEWRSTQRVPVRVRLVPMHCSQPCHLLTVTVDLEDACAKRFDEQMIVHLATRQLELEMESEHFSSSPWQRLKGKAELKFNRISAMRKYKMPVAAGNWWATCKPMPSQLSLSATDAHTSANGTGKALLCSRQPVIELMQQPFCLREYFDLSIDFYEKPEFAEEFHCVTCKITFAVARDSEEECHCFQCGAPTSEMPSAKVWNYKPTLIHDCNDFISLTHFRKAADKRQVVLERVFAAAQLFGGELLCETMRSVPSCVRYKDWSRQKSTGSNSMDAWSWKCLAGLEFGERLTGLSVAVVLSSEGIHRMRLT